ncbi:MAG TPA: hypothetical protein VN026_12410 [Bacteroidia bacterium]|jgi:hypothetical protein|nr:hypothetical protein [Bacteroidia bacterium]
MAIKYWESFLESEKNEFGAGVFNYEKENPEPKSWGYQEDDQSFNFEFHGDQDRLYTLKVFPQLECFVLSFPKGEYQWCAFSALIANRDRFINYEKNGVLYSWLVKRIMYIDYKIHIEQADWSTLRDSDFGEQN